MSMAPAWVRDRLSDQGRKALVESQCTPPSRTGRDASGGKKVTAVDAAFFYFTDGS